MFNTCCGIAPLAHNLPNCRTVRNASGPSWRVAVNIVFLEVFLFVIASPGSRHTGLFDISVSHLVVVCTWLTHVTDAGQSGTSLLLDDFGRQSHVLY